jgi:hypothetical protein
MKQDTPITIVVPPWQPTICIIRHNRSQVNIITTITITVTFTTIRPTFQLTTII